MKTPSSSSIFAKRTQELRSFIAMDVLEASQKLRQQGHDVINFSIGEPDFTAPTVVKNAVLKAIKNDFTQYTHSLGMPELRQAIAKHYHQRYGVKLHPDRILVTAGTSPAILLILGALLDAGDEVILSDPRYPCYSNFIRFFGGKIIDVVVREEDGFEYRPEEVRKKITAKTKAIFLNSPSNPTGCTLSKQVMRQLAKLSPYLISDEIYHGLTYEGEEHSILEFTNQAFVFNGFSKSYAMTGFRLGYCIFPEEFREVMQKMAQNFYISTSSFIQVAGLAALTKAAKDQEKMRKAFAKRRKVMVEGLKKLGFKIAVEPQGAFYVFANAKHFTQDSYQFAFDLLKKKKVGVTPGIDFGPSGEGFIRFSYATDIPNIKEGLKRIQEYLNENQAPQKKLRSLIRRKAWSLGTKA